MHTAAGLHLHVGDDRVGQAPAAQPTAVQLVSLCLLQQRLEQLDKLHHVPQVLDLMENETKCKWEETPQPGFSVQLSMPYKLRHKRA
jgi:hypothetical protein